MKRILIVDDNKEFVLAFLVFLRKRFGEASFSETYSESGAAALKELEKSTFDLIISDFEMENGDGLFLLEALEHLKKKIPIFILTATPEAFIENSSKNLKAVIGKSEFGKLASYLENYMR